MSYHEIIDELDFTGLIQSRLDICIAVMQRAVDNKRVFDLNNWQIVDFGESIKNTEEELHNCGMAACFGGWLAVSPEFIALGGGRSLVSGRPSFKSYYAENAINAFLGLDYMKGMGVLLVMPSSRLYDGVYTEDITAQHVLDRLNYIKKVTSQTNEEL